MTDPPTTWHYGLIADHWARNNLDAPEVEVYAPYLRSPVLDAGCGTGRLLAPLRERGLDVDGCDVSGDMLDRCRQRVPDATLWVSPLHELEPPRKYASIVCSGVFGLGTTRDQDGAALRRLHEALVPGGVLVLDNEESAFTYEVGDWRKPSDGAIRLSSRVDAVDAEDRSARLTIRAETADGRREEYVLTLRQWYRDELEPALRAAGFASVEVFPSPVVENTLVYVARRA